MMVIQKQRAYKDDHQYRVTGQQLLIAWQQSNDGVPTCHETYHLAAHKRSGWLRFEWRCWQHVFAGVIEVLAEGLKEKNERVRRRIMATLGELLFYVATQQQVNYKQLCLHRSCSCHTLLHSFSKAMRHVSALYCLCWSWPDDHARLISLNSNFCLLLMRCCKAQLQMPWQCVQQIRPCKCTKYHTEHHDDCVPSTL